MEKIIPNINIEKFTCPHCGNTCIQEWKQVGFKKDDELFVKLQAKLEGNPDKTPLENLRKKIVIYISRCSTCEGKSVWINGEMVYPNIGVEKPSKDMPPKVLAIYEEASSIVGKSPRCACALLRLSIELLCDCEEIKAQGKDLDDKIRCLVSRGLPSLIQKALDDVRVIGNKAIHAGEIGIDFDDFNVASSLFSIINVIVGYMITQNRAINDLYDKLPSSIINTINRKDNSKIKK